MRINKTLFAAALVIVMLPFSAKAQECTAGAAAFAASTVENVAAKCCSRKARSAQNKCLDQARQAIAKTRAILTKDVTGDINGGLTALKNNGCNMQQLGTLECSAAQSATITEVKNKVQKRACSLKYKSDRQERLGKFRRSIRKARPYLGSEYGRSVLKEIRKLRRSNSCGESGESRNGCDVVKEPYDGALRGYLWKPFADHNPRPVWLSPSYRGAVTLITPEGKWLSNMAFTGVANGNRGHYRPSLTCQQMPGVVYVKEGGTCFIINGPCRRHD